MAAEALMGFLTGFAKTGKERIEKEREDNEELIASRLKMAATNKMVRDKEVAAKKAELSERLKTVEAIAPGASFEQTLGLVSNAQIFDSYKSLAEKGEAPDLNTFLKINKDKVPQGYTSVRQYIDKQFTAPAPVPEDQMAALTGGKGFMGADVGVSAGRAEKLARGMGGTARELLAYEQKQAAPEMESFASYDVSALKPAKTMTEESFEDQKKIAYYKAAEQYGEDSPQAKEAKAAVDTFKLRQEVLSPKQLKWAEEVDSLKRAAIRGTSEQQAAAKKELKKIWAQELEQKQATRIANEGGDGEGAIPKLGSLATSAERAANAEAIRQFGQGVTKDFVVTKNPLTDEYVGRYEGNNEAMRKYIQYVKDKKASELLSTYTLDGKPANNQVLSAYIQLGLPVSGNKVGELPVVPDPRASATPPPPTAPEKARSLGERLKKPAAAPAVAAPTATTPAPKTKAEYDQLPPGTVYVDTDGVTKRKK